MDQHVGNLLAAAASGTAGGRDALQELENMQHANGGQYFEALAGIVSTPTPPNLSPQDASSFETIRNLAALTIKRCIAHDTNCSGAAGVQSAVVQHIGDHNRSIRGAMASAVASAVVSGAWPTEAIGAVVGKLNEVQAQAQQATSSSAGLVAEAAAYSSMSGYVRALSFVVEDCIELLETTDMGGGDMLSAALANVLVPLIAADTILSGQFPQGNDRNALNSYVAARLEILRRAVRATVVLMEQASTNDKGAAFYAIRGMAGPIVQCTLSILEKNQMLRQHFDSVDAAAVNAIIGDCVKCIVFSLPFMEVVEAQLPTFFQLMLAVMQAPDDAVDVTVKQEAATFWRACTYFPQSMAALKQGLGDVVPVLVACCVYSDNELGNLSSKVGDGGVPDRPQDVKPRQRKGRSREFHDEDGNDDNNEADDDEVEEDTLRTVCALTLDELAKVYGDDMLNLVLSCCNGMMQPGNGWRKLEAGVLVLGAITEGCFEGLRPVMPQIVSRCLDLLEDNNDGGGSQSDRAHYFLVRQICLWTIGQMSEYLMDGSCDEDRGGVQFTQQRKASMERYIRAILALMSTNTKSMQESAVTSLGEVLQSASNYLPDEQTVDETVFLGPIVTTCAACLSQYQLKNLMTLCETLEIVFQYFGPTVGNDDCMGALIPPISKLWLNTANNSPLLPSLLECMSALCTAAKSSMEPLAKEIFDRAITLITFYLNKHRNANNGQQQAPGESEDYGIDDDDFLVTAIDLLSGLFDAMGSSLEPLIRGGSSNNNEVPLIQMLHAALHDDEATAVRKAAFAVVGDVAGACPALIQQNLQPVAEKILAQLQFIEATINDFIQRTGGNQRRKTEIGKGAGNKDLLLDSDIACTANAAWALSEIIANQLDLQDLPTVGTEHFVFFLSPIVNIINFITGDTQASNLSENLCLLLGRILRVEGSGAALLSRVGLNITDFALAWCNAIRNVKNMDWKDDAVRGFFATLQQHQQQGNGPKWPPQVIVSLLDVIGSVATSASSDLKQAIKVVVSTFQQQQGQEWGQAWGAYGQEQKRRLQINLGI